MDERAVPVAGMTISVRIRRDVVVVDPERFMAAARSAYRESNPELTEDEAAEDVVDVYDAVDALLRRDGQLAPDEVKWGEPSFGRGAPLPGVRVLDRPDGLSPAGWLGEIVLDEPKPLQDYGCFVPLDPPSGDPS